MTENLLLRMEQRDDAPAIEALLLEAFPGARALLTPPSGDLPDWILRD